MLESSIVSHGERLFEEHSRSRQAVPRARHGPARSGLTDNPKTAAELGFFDIVGAKTTRVKMIVVNEGGHFMYREHPEQFNADLIAFIEFWKNNPKAQ